MRQKTSPTIALVAGQTVCSRIDQIVSDLFRDLSRENHTEIGTRLKFGTDVRIDAQR
jgi:hypothetical protein